MWSKSKDKIQNHLKLVTMLSQVWSKCICTSFQLILIHHVWKIKSTGIPSIQNFSFRIKVINISVDLKFQTLIRRNQVCILLSLDLVKRIEVDGKFAKLDASVVKELLARPLRCNHCNATQKTIPNLKSHLLTHLK